MHVRQLQEAARSSCARMRARTACRTSTSPRAAAQPGRVPARRRRQRGQCAAEQLVRSSWIPAAATPWPRTPCRPTGRWLPHLQRWLSGFEHRRCAGRDGHLHLRQQRPRRRSPTRAPRAPRRCAFRLSRPTGRAAAPNRTHGPPLAFPSCNPPVVSQSSSVTIGSPDANGSAANPSASVRYEVMVPRRSGRHRRADRGSVTDVRCKAGTMACGNSNAADGADYTGQLRERTI